jgi:uncharacterized membrane protein YagU involved in acid resistance
MRKKTPARAWIEGLIAGAVGAGVQSLFFRSTARIMPKPPKDAFMPPEEEQHDESALETVARRAVEDLAQRGPLEARDKRHLGQAVHYAFGAAWGGLYGILRASYPRRLWNVSGVAAFSLGVWMLGDNVILPVFRLSAWPHRYPMRSHAYAVAAHLAYGAGVAATLEVCDHARLLPLGAAFLLARGRAVGARAAEVARDHALVPRDVVEQSRHLAAAIARRARDLRH